jgi:initiation factor 1A
MPNFSGGSKWKKHKKGAKDNNQQLPIITDDPLFRYGKVKKALGSKRFSTECNDTKIRNCSIKIRQRINSGDYVLVQLVDYNDSDSYIIHKYNKEDMRFLKTQEEFKFNSDENENDYFGENNTIDSEEEDEIYNQVNIASRKEISKTAAQKRNLDRNNKNNNLDEDSPKENINFDDL